MIKTIYEYDNRYFDDESDVSEYIANKIGGNYNNIDPTSTAEFHREWEEVEEKFPNVWEKIVKRLRVIVPEVTENHNMLRKLKEYLKWD